MIGWDVIVVVMGILMAGFAIYLEYRRVDRARLGWRIAAALVAVAALMGFALPVHYNSSKQAISKAGPLVTAGFNRDSIDKNAIIYTLDKQIHQQHPEIKLIDDLGNWFNGAEVYGYGLSQQELNKLNGRPIIFHPATLPDGVVAANWTEQITSGQQFKVQGGYQNTSAKPVKLYLSGLTTALDSAIIQPKSTTRFSFTASPKNAGRLIYNLLAMSGRDTLQSEYLPVVISPAQPIKVLMLSASPNFEARFLKSWLGDHGYGIAARSAITKGKISQDYTNIDRIDLNRITPQTLAKFDVVISDQSAIDELSAPETAALQQEITQKSLGLIVRADSSSKKGSWVARNFVLQQQLTKPTIEASLLLQNEGKTSKLIIDQDFIASQNNIQPLVTDDRQHLLVGATLTGAGKLILTTLNQTYSWALAGNQKDYAGLWSLLLDKAERKTNALVKWRVATHLPMVNQPIQLSAESADALVDVKINGATVYPAQDAALPFSRQYTYWPAITGWQQITQQKEPPYWWYVWRETDWRTLVVATKLAITSAYSKRAIVTSKLSTQKIKVTVPKIYFYILFLMAMAFLWIERKFFSI